MGSGSPKTWRAHLILMVILIGFCALGYRLVGLTVLQHQFLKHQGSIRSTRVIEMPSARGSILDRHGRPLAVSLPATNIWFNPKQSHWTHSEAHALAKALGMPLRTILAKTHNRHRGFVYLKKKTSESVWHDVQQLYLKGVHAEHTYNRFYPMADETAQLLGLTNASGHGQEGLELGFDGWLRGHPGKQIVEKDRMGHIIAVKKVLSAAKVGQPIRLTIDRRIQSIAYTALKDGMQKYGAKQGSLVVLQPKTGAILAMANWPSFNPNNLKHVDFSHVKNHAATDLFEPGSTIKTFSMIHALGSGQFNVHTRIDTGARGVFKVHGHEVRDEFMHHGVLSPTDILRKSSNVGIAKMTLALPPEGLPNLLSNLGFFHLALGLPGEATGYIRQRYTIDPFELATLSFGYGMTTTHVQLAHAYAVLANHGVDPGLYLMQNTPHAKPKRVFSEGVARAVTTMLQHVLDRAGTGFRARIPGVQVAGKTGTAHVAMGGRYAKDVYMSSFVGMFPATAPEYVVSVVLKAPDAKYYFGGLSAAPIFSEVGSKLMRLRLATKGGLP